MMKKVSVTIAIILTAALATAMICRRPVLALVMSSTNYRLQVDSINFGGVLSTSTNYQLEDTLGEVGTGIVTSTSYNLYAGYQQMEAPYISITISDSVTMSGSIAGLTGGTATGTGTVKVTTNNTAGYTLYTRASTTPALKSGSESFADYTPQGANPDFTWQVAVTSSAFGFSPEGNDIPTKYKDNGLNTCNQSGGPDTANACWDYFTTSNATIASNNVRNNPSGTTTTIKFKAESGTQHIQPSGTYTATIIMTAVAN